MFWEFDGLVFVNTVPLSSWIEVHPKVRPMQCSKTQVSMINVNVCEGARVWLVWGRIPFLFKKKCTFGN